MECMLYTASINENILTVGPITFHTDPLVKEYCHDTASVGRLVIITFPVDAEGKEVGVVEAGNVTSITLMLRDIKILAI